ncbi:copper transporter [Virgisporangium ochraceum]|uniref:Copper transporter n=1 Tax=Virgisporangium ochraceum TaxID=65505 RepID=A0A8J4A341_9ACTN|nr:copper transporter [Virgisporangium ochraceum]GIJ73672.1 hypothetical protein Voc01_085890 [Virgisporangium ochraceum]
MINFRYHVVSIAAVFLALALGLIVGTAAFNGPAADSLAAQVDEMGKTNNQLRDQLNHLNEEAEQEERFATEVGPWAVGSRLNGKRVLVLTTTDAEKDYVDGVTEALKAAGVTVTGQLAFQKRFVDPASKEELLDLVDNSTPETVTGLPTNTNGAETASALLAAVLVDRTPAVTQEQRTKTLTAFTGSYLVGATVKEPAEAVLVLAGAPYKEKDAGKLNAGLKTIVEQFDKAGPLLVAAESTAGDGNLVGAVRGDSTLSKPVSTVDNAGSPQGRVGVMLALADQIEGKTPGHYGVSGQNGLVPKAPAGAKNGS